MEDERAVEHWPGGGPQSCRGCTFALDEKTITILPDGRALVEFMMFPNDELPVIGHQKIVGWSVIDDKGAIAERVVMAFFKYYDYWIPYGSEFDSLEAARKEAIRRYIVAIK